MRSAGPAEKRPWLSGRRGGRLSNTWCSARLLPGIIAAVVLGFSRAFGETMAVLMVVGNVAKIPHSIFDPAYPLTALIANNYGEMMSVPLYDAALLAAALILLLVVFVFNLVALYPAAGKEERGAMTPMMPSRSPRFREGGESRGSRSGSSSRLMFFRLSWSPGSLVC